MVTREADRTGVTYRGGVDTIPRTEEVLLDTPTVREGLTDHRKRTPSRSRPGDEWETE